MHTYKTATDIELVYTSYVNQETTNACVVLLSGLPYNPQKEYNVVKNLNADGYDVYVPHYDGTWGSSGSFLKQNPTVSIDDFVKTLTSENNLLTGNRTYTNIFIIGTSFGGGLALTLKNSRAISAVCVLSPVISYRRVAGIETLSDYLQTECSDTYHFDKKDMQALIADKLISPEKQMVMPKEKVLVFAGENDDQIQPTDIAAFCSMHNIKLHTVPTGHITFSKIDETIYKKLLVFFNANRLS